ncbi:ACP phosphodiesterase [Christiangramia salexigens]|uniref:ACP phosphodiesterase n=1 Tax=Christiangramia salexigens TaxID=1913577 RepID=A0A1L3J2A2_9FLAO|nr:acyl carrier protein phosphodiesterase [Christiangramia salexigens]APG59249.1 ACP phosphodiesterase [Christiangramia salexigens]
MNFLAHIYLSGNDDLLKIGNFMADSIKGKKYQKYSPSVQNGIILHRAIDYYTDTHPIVKESTQRLFPTYGHYSGIIIDIFYDHFLAANWNKYSNIPLKTYTLDFYTLLKENYDLLPLKVQGFLPYMINDNWLYSYSHLEGIEKVLQGMNRRTGKKSDMHLAIAELKQHYEKFEDEFERFFEELVSFSKTKIEELTSNKKTD